MRWPISLRPALVLLLVSACASAPSASPEASASATPAAATSPSEPASSEAASPTTDPAPDEWTRVLTAGDGSLQVVAHQVAWGSAGFLAIGSAYEGAEGGPRLVENFAWLSADGRAWEELPIPSELGDLFSRLLTTSADGDFVLHSNRPVGLQGNSEHVSFRSSDGVGWEEFESGLPDEVFVQAVERGPQGYLLVAGRAVNINPTLWLSDDGIAWEQVHEFEQTTHFVQIDDADGGAEGYVVFGRRIEPDGPYIRFAFASADGRDWFTTEEPFGPSNQQFGFATTVSGTGPDWVATLPQPGGAPTDVWHSEDGLNWTARGTIDAEPNVSSGVMETTGLGLLFAPSSGAAPFDGLAGLWSSTDDGATWEQHDLGADAWVNGLAESPGIVAVSGATAGDAFNSSAGIWIRSTE